MTQLAFAGIWNTFNPPVALPLGVYAGVEGGFSKVNDGNPLISTVQQALRSEGGSINNSSFSKEWAPGGRLFAGWQFNHHFGLEFGFNAFENKSSSMSIVNPATDGQGNPIPNPGVTSLSYDLKTQAFDFLLTGSMPLGPTGFQGYLKGGMAYVIPTGILHAIDTSATDPVDFTLRLAAPKWRPTLGVGTLYMMNSNIGFNLFWQHFWGKSTPAIPTNATGATPLINGDFPASPTVDIVGIGARLFYDYPTVSPVITK